MKHTRILSIPTFDRYRAARIALTAAAIGAALALAASTAHAQRHGRTAVPSTLHGSKASVEKMYSFAQRYRYPFYLTPTNIDSAIARGRLVELTGDSTYELTRGVQKNYATREAKQFITSFAPQYLWACGTPLTVTSAARAITRQPRNANPHSVHPTGIAVDLRRPFAGPCLTWLRSSLATLEARGIIEATEERHPVHIHIAVLAPPGSRVTLPNLVQGVAMAPRQPGMVQVAAQTAAPKPANVFLSGGEVVLAPRAAAVRRDSLPARRTPRVYVVRQGDTIYDIASRTGVSMKALIAANRIRERSVLKPGTAITIPQTDDGVR